MVSIYHQDWAFQIKRLIFELDEIYSYEKQALDAIPKDHPHYDEIRALLIDQINDQIADVTHSKPN